MTPKEREELHRRLDNLIDHAPNFDSIEANGYDDNQEGTPAEDFRRWRDAQLHLTSALRLVSEAVGERTIFEHANARGFAALSQAGRILQLASMWLAPPCAQSALNRIAFELIAIEAGELPRLIKPGERPKKLPPNVYRRWHFQLTALCWDYRLEAIGYATQDRRRIIEDAYAHPWRTIAGWLPSIREGLGNLAVDVGIKFARLDTERWLDPSISREMIISAVASDGAAYIADNRIAKGMAARK